MKSIPYESNPALSPELNPTTPEYIPNVVNVDRNRYPGSWGVDTSGSISPRTSPYSSPQSSPRDNGPYVSPSMSPKLSSRVDYPTYSPHYGNQTTAQRQYYGNQGYSTQTSNHTFNGHGQQYPWATMNGNPQTIRSPGKETNSSPFRVHNETLLYGPSSVPTSARFADDEALISERAREKKKSLQPSSFFHYGNIFLERNFEV